MRNTKKATAEATVSSAGVSGRIACTKTVVVPEKRPRKSTVASKPDGESGGSTDARHYELYVNEDELGLEYLTLTRLVDLADAPKNDIPREKLAGLACRIYDARRTRTRFFHNSLLGEPVWDMLLALYCLPSRKERLSVSGLCLAAGVPLTTALRWEQLMEQKGLIERQGDPTDNRRVYLSLSNSGDDLMSSYLATISHTLVAP